MEGTLMTWGNKFYLVWTIVRNYKHYNIPLYLLNFPSKAEHVLKFVIIFYLILNINVMLRSNKYMLLPVY